MTILILTYYACGGKNNTKLSPSWCCAHYEPAEKINSMEELFNLHWNIVSYTCEISLLWYKLPLHVVHPQMHHCEILFSCETHTRVHAKFRAHAIFLARFFYFFIVNWQMHTFLWKEHMQLLVKHLLPKRYQTTNEANVKYSLLTTNALFASWF